MTFPDHDDAVAAARGLTGSVDGLGEKVRDLATAVRRSRFQIRLLAAGSAVLAAVLAVAVIALVQSRHASTQAATANAKAAAIHASNLASCRSGNGNRAGQVQLWRHVVAVAPPETARQRKVDAEFIAYVRHLFASRDCTAIYKVP